ncbi:autotransporter domain-containing protein [Enterobacteriaceae bacterium H11S18]|uniref:S6 family peptidase n=1 Tax=Dryocola clanedunensis TaxID=2925396 RepID=UPI0022F0124D|nr:S6 family peptidase [Dryocola clanedunensis]MCT4710319.1 autotransporter domain-containing protein [Dryocola clanedunensis]
MKFRKSLIASLVLLVLSENAHAALVRDDIPVQVYRDFGENRGAFKAGATNVPVYLADGSLSGIIANVPDFSASVDGGWSTLIAPNVTATARHLNYDDNISFGKRSQQLDATLFSGAENASSYTLMNEVTKRAYDVSANIDYRLTRHRTLITDAAPAEIFTDLSQITKGLLVARVGGGYMTVANPDGTTTYLYYGPQGGGLNIIDRVYNSGVAKQILIQFARDPLTPLDVGTVGGDSGSGMWGWDSVSQSWKFLAINSAGSGSGYGKWSYLYAAPDWTQEILESFNDAAINTRNASDVIHVGSQDAVSGEGDFTLNGETIRYHGIRTDIAESELAREDFETNKNLIFGGAGGVIELDGANVNLGAGSLTFNADYTLTDGGDASRRLNSAGYIINEGATLLSTITGSLGDTWRKLGAGTLVVAGQGDNHAGLNVGDGLTILQREGGHAAETIHIGSGRAVVRLGADHQLDGTQVGFGNQGGILDLYGQSLSWADIIHMDNGATIAASKAGKQSTFTFTGSGPKTYLGNFIDGGSLDKGLLHLVYAPELQNSSWTLKGNIDTRGGMEINNGKVAVQGASTLHAAGYVDPTEFEQATFDLGDSLVQLRASQFAVGRNAIARGQFVLDDNSSIVLNSAGELASSEQGILEGAYLDGSVDLQGANSTVQANADEGFLVKINASLRGMGRLIKNGLGSLLLSGENDLQGGMDINAGSLTLSNRAVAAGGDIRLNGGDLAFNNDLDADYNAVLSGSTGNVMKLGSGRLTFNRNNTFNQTVLVDEGTLEIGDRLHQDAGLAGDVAVNPGATLRGYGSLGGSLFNSGAVRPAGAGSSLRIAGNYQQSPDAQLLIDFDPLAGASSLEIAGSAQLAGGLQTIYAPGTYRSRSYNILTAQQGVSGEFASVTKNGADELAQSITYDANNVLLTTTGGYVDPVTPTDPDDPLPPAPEIVVRPGNLHAYDPQLLAIGLQEPHRRSRDQVDWSATADAEPKTCSNWADCGNHDTMWVTPYYSNGSGSNSLSAKIKGISVGGYLERGNSRFGAAADYADFDLNAVGSSASADRYAVSLFASQKLSDTVLTGSLGYTHSPSDITRQVSSNGLAVGEGKSRVKANALSAGMSASWPLSVVGMQIVPQVGIDSLNVYYASFDESMSANSQQFASMIGNMKVHGASNRYDSLQPNVGVKVSRPFDIAGTAVTPNLNLTWRHELMNNNDSNVYSNDGTMFTVESDTLGRDIMEYGAGVKVDITPSLSASLNGKGQYQKGYHSLEGLIDVRYQF